MGQCVTRWIGQTARAGQLRLGGGRGNGCARGRQGRMGGGSSQPATVLVDQRAGAPSWTGPRWWRWRSHTPQTSAAGSAEQFGTGGDKGTVYLSLCAHAMPMQLQLACGFPPMLRPCML